MQLTQHTDFGIRLLVVLARSDGRPVPLTRFAEERGLSYNHVAKVAQALVHAGFVVSHRGRSGGVSLARGPHDIRIGDVVRALEPNMQIADCPACTMRNECSAEDMLGDALSAFMAVLDDRSLAQAARINVTHANEFSPLYH